MKAPNYNGRRHFIKAGAVASLSLLASGQVPQTKVFGKLRVLSVGVGSIGAVDRKNIESHPMAEITGLCDVDSEVLKVASVEHPKAFTCKDYREAFTKYIDRFDAVIVSTRDHSHASIILTALAHNKHVYAQKPLVHHLAELNMVERAIHARPSLVTQMANQRMVIPGRRAAVEILRSGVIGKAICAHVWIVSPDHQDAFYLDRVFEAHSEPPDTLDWNLWLCGSKMVPYRSGIAPMFWRAWWDYGNSGIGDWGCHLVDVLFYAYDALHSPIAVQTFVPPTKCPHFHLHPCRSTVTYAVNDDRFANTHFPIFFSDSGQEVSRASLGLPEGRYMNGNMTVVVCERGVLCLAVDGELEVWRDGKMTPGLDIPGLPEFPELNHWHQWVDGCIGVISRVQTPFRDGVRITEPCLLAVKAARYPGQELRWDRGALSFTNHEEASATIVSHTYRQGFAPPDVF